MADKASPEKKSWADVEEEEEAKAKAEAAAAAAAASSSSTSEPAVEAQAKQIESLSLAPPEDDAAGEEGPPLLDDSDDAQIQAVRPPCPSHTPAGASPSQSRLLRVAD
jgi:ATP-dependent RNA helicase DDX19/DBP5